MYDYLVVGAGFSGSVIAERISSVLHKRVMVVDKRDHIGGNAYDYHNSEGILVHKYGPHWFHTKDRKVFDYLSMFTEWRYHYHRVKTYVDGLLLPFPINMDTINKLYGMNLQSPKEVQRYLDSVKEKIENPQNAEEMVISLVGRDLYDKFYRNYTKKQWDLEPKELSASITARIPVRTNRDDRYFSDTYQGIPKYGYTELFRRMLLQKNVHLLLQTDYRDVVDEIKFNTLIYTGPIDEYFDYAHGRLSYRSLRFEHESFDQEYYQVAQQINYPNDYDYTRIIEWKHATGQKHHRTTITREYPLAAQDDLEKYYPILTNSNSEIFRRYTREAEKLKSVHFCGRLADFRYYNMDQVVARALTLFEKVICAT